MQVSKDLIAASAVPLVLSILEKGDNYGYAIIKKVSELSEERIRWTDGMLYPVLHRIEKQRCVESYWRTSSTGRKRKYYRITAAGIGELREHQRQWRAVNAALRRAWEEDLSSCLGQTAIGRFCHV